jgi:hypothetical protein
MTTEQKHLGLAGQLAQSFIRSKLTVLMVAASLAFGLVATLALPREEEPQINVPMFDVFVGMPGGLRPGGGRAVDQHRRAEILGNPRRGVRLFHGRSGAGHVHSAL